MDASFFGLVAGDVNHEALQPIAFGVKDKDANGKPK
jgi:hypothetical protein